MKTTKTLAIALSLTTLIFNSYSLKSKEKSNYEFNDNILLTTDLIKEDIEKYLQDNGYTLESSPEQDGDEWTCYTAKGTEHYFTTVFTDGPNIIVHTDVRL
jgi:hypothetical protein